MNEILLGGLGGQGVLTAGVLLAEMAMYQGYQATWSPEYGSAMRGGTANCTVKYNKGRIYNPTKEAPDLLLAMNDVAFKTYAPLLKEGGIMVVNSDMVEVDDVRPDIHVVKVPCMSLAEEIGHPLGANIIMCGVIMKLLGEFEENAAAEGMNAMFRAKGKEKFEAKNTEAFHLGYHYEPKDE